MSLVVLPFAVVLRAAGEHCHAGALPLVIPPSATVGVAIRAGVKAAAMTQVTDNISLYDKTDRRSRIRPYAEVLQPRLRWKYRGEGRGTGRDLAEHRRPVLT